MTSRSRPEGRRHEQRPYTVRPAAVAVNLSATTLRACANPVCRAEIDPRQEDSIELAQLQRPDPDAGAAWITWYLCDTTCVRQYLALCDMKARASAACHDHPNRAEGAEA